MKNTKLLFIALLASAMGIAGCQQTNKIDQKPGDDNNNQQKDDNNQQDNNNNQQDNNNDDEKKGPSFAEIVEICKSLNGGVTSNETYTFDAYVSSSFDVKESTQTAGAYSFNLCDKSGSDELIAWYLEGEEKPSTGDLLTVTGKLQHYVDKKGNSKYEVCDGSFVIKEKAGSGDFSDFPEELKSIATSIAATLFNVDEDEVTFDDYENFDDTEAMVCLYDDGDLQFADIYGEIVETDADGLLEEVENCLPTSAELDEDYSQSDESSYYYFYFDDEIAYAVYVEEYDDGKETGTLAAIDVFNTEDLDLYIDFFTAEE